MSIKNLEYYAKDLFVKGGYWHIKRKAKGRNFIDKVLKDKNALLDNYIIPLFGNYNPRQITQKIVNEKLLRLDLAPATKNKILSCLSDIYTHLIEEEILEVNPSQGILRFCGQNNKRGALSPDEIKILFPFNHDELIRIWGSQVYATAFLVLKDTGLRPNELRALQWQDWHRDIHFFPITKAIEAGTRSKIKGTKTGSVKPALVSEQTAREMEQLRFTANPLPEDFIFMCSSGLPMSESRISANFRTGVKRAGLDRPEITPYWLRHTFNTRMLEHLPGDEVRRLMGHSTEAMTRHYRDADIQSLQREAEKIYKKIQRVHNNINDQNPQMLLQFSN